MILKIKSYTAIKERLEKILEFPKLVETTGFQGYMEMSKLYRFKTYNHFWTINYNTLRPVKLKSIHKYIIYPKKSDRSSLRRYYTAN